jgi:hypothetical protein
LLGEQISLIAKKFKRSIPAASTINMRRHANL